MTRRLFRKLNSINPWRHDAGTSPIADIPSDVLGCLRTTGCKLSFYRVDGDLDLPSIVAGLASTRDTIQEMDYALVDEAILEQRGLRLLNAPGNTLSRRANELHVDVVSLTVTSLGVLASCIYSSGKIGRIAKREVLSMLSSTFHSGDLDASKLKDAFRTKIGL